MTEAPVYTARREVPATNENFRCRPISCGGVTEIIYYLNTLQKFKFIKFIMAKCDFRLVEKDNCFARCSGESFWAERSSPHADQTV